MHATLKSNGNKKTLMVAIAAALGTAGLFFAGNALAIDIGEMSTGISGRLGGVLDLIGTGSTVAGAGTGVGAIMKFKAHKDDPRSTPLSTPIVMLVVSAALVALPSVMDTGTQSLWGTTSGKSTDLRGSMGVR